MVELVGYSCSNAVQVSLSNIFILLKYSSGHMESRNRRLHVQKYIREEHLCHRPAVDRQDLTISMARLIIVQEAHDTNYAAKEASILACFSKKDNRCNNALASM